MKQRSNSLLIAGALAGLVLLILTALILSLPPEKKTDLPATPDESLRLTVYTSHREDVWWPIVKEFEERTGIWVDVVEGGTNELLAQLAREKDAPVCDVMFGGGAESLTSMSALFEPYAVPEEDAIDPRYAAEGHLWTPFSSLPIVLVYNPKLLHEGELTGWGDLFSERFRGRIAFADPAVSGSSFTALVTILLSRDWEHWEETLIDFAAAVDGKELESSGDVLSQVENGTMLAGIALEEAALLRIGEGGSLRLVYPAEGTSCVPDGAALIRGAPHGDNARRFIDFCVSADVQKHITSSRPRRSVRTDIPSGARMPSLDDIPMVEYSIPEVADMRNTILNVWAFYAGKEEP